jgi:acetyl esterase/lipase
MGLFGTACSPLIAFDRVVPKDSGSAHIEHGIAYGNDPRQTLDIYAPTAGRDRSDSLPVIIFFYGGNWSDGTRAGYSFVGRAFAARHFITVIPDYRLVPTVRYPAFVEDGAAAVRWVKKHAARYGGDPDRIVVIGHSAGAYIAAMLAIDGRWLGTDRQAIKGFVGIAGPYDFAPFDVAASQNAFGAWPDPPDTQPITWVSKDDPPTLLLVGDADETVRPRNSEALAARLRSANVAVKIIRYPKLGHVGVVTAIARPLRNKGAVLNDAVTFARQVTHHQ